MAGGAAAHISELPSSSQREIESLLHKVTIMIHKNYTCIVRSLHRHVLCSARQAQVGLGIANVTSPIQQLTTSFYLNIVAIELSRWEQLLDWKTLPGRKTKQNQNIREKTVCTCGYKVPSSV